MVFPISCNTLFNPVIYLRLFAMLYLSELNRKDATCIDLFRCVFGLKEFDEAIIHAMAGKGVFTLDTLAEATGRDRSTVHRSLGRLVSLGLCYRNSVTLREGGYVYQYSLMDVESIGATIRGKVDELKSSLDRLIENFEPEMERKLLMSAGAK